MEITHVALPGGRAFRMALIPSLMAAVDEHSRAYGTGRTVGLFLVTLIVVIVGRYLLRGRSVAVRPKAILLALAAFSSLTVFGELLYVVGQTK